MEVCQLAILERNSFRHLFRRDCRIAHLYHDRQLDWVDDEMGQCCPHQSVVPNLSVYYFYSVLSLQIFLFYFEVSLIEKILNYLLNKFLPHIPLL